MVGMASGIIGFGLGLLAPIALKYLSFPYGYACWACAVIFFQTVCALLMLKVTELPDLAEAKLPPKTSPFKNFANVVKLREFQVLMPANLLRGFGDGVNGFIVAVALKQGLDTTAVGWTTAILPVASFCATGIIGVCSDKFGAGKLLPIINSLLVLGLIGSLFCMKQTLFSSSIYFVCCYFLWYMMQQMEANAIPLVHYDVVPPEVMGAFTGVRLFCLNLTMGLSGMLVGLALDHAKAIIVFGVCGALKITAGLLYYASVVLLKHNKKA
jgi:predicted MFS family arabinose efflux permease